MRFFLLLFVGINILFISCKTTKTFTNRTIKKLNNDAIYDSLRTINKSYNEFYSRFTVDIKSDKNLSLKGTLKIKKDSIIWLSLNPGLGIEIVRIKMEPDSIFILDRLRNTFYYGDYSYLKKLSNVDVNFDIMQSLLLNDLLIYYPGKHDTTVFKQMVIQDDKLNNKLKLQTIKNKELRKITKNDVIPDLIFQELIINGNWKIESNSITDYKYNRQLNVNYGEYEVFEKNIFPKNLTINITDNDKNFDIQMSYSKIEFNKKNKYSFNIPSKYDKVKY